MVWWWSKKWFLVHFRELYLRSRGTPSRTVRADWRIIPYSTEKHWRYPNYRCNLDVMSEKHIDDNWNVDGNRELSDAWTGSRDSLYWMRNHLMDIHGPWWAWRGNKRFQDPTMWGQICGSICLMHRNAKKSKNGPSRNQNSIMSEDCVDNRKCA